VSTPTAWIQVASTSLVPLTNEMNGQILRPYLDNTVNALDKTGEKAFTSDLFDMMTGSGLSAPNFPPAASTL
jgi:hypothetical protein